MKDTKKYKNKLGLTQNKLYDGEYERERWKNIIKFMKSDAKRKKMTQIKISELTGIPQPNVSRFFKAEIVPNLDTFISVSDALGLFFSPKVWKGLSNYHEIKEGSYNRIGTKERDRLNEIIRNAAQQKITVPKITELLVKEFPRKNKKILAKEARKAYR